MARPLVLAAGLIAAAMSLVPTVQGCSSGGDASGPADCVAAGGTCVLGGNSCEKVGPQDCNPTGNPGGAFCCLVAVVGDDGVDSSDLCEAAGGVCRAAGATCTTVVGPVEACGSDQLGGSFCCAVAPDVGLCSAGATPAASYDLSCASDRDCIAVHEGDFCSLCALNCPNATISVSAQAQYMLDYAKTPAGVSAQRAACAGDCAFESPPCCMSGRCQLGGQCSITVLVADAGARDAATDAGSADEGTGTDIADGGANDAAADANSDVALGDGSAADAD